jgi:hypothetical protein
MVAQHLRQAAFPESPTGAAHIRWNPSFEQPAALQSSPLAIVALMRQTIRPDSQAGWAEQAVTLHFFAVSLAISEIAAIAGRDRQLLIRGLLQSTIRAKPEPAGELVVLLGELEHGLVQSLRRPSEEDLSTGIRHAVTPVLAAIVTT